MPWREAETLQGSSVRLAALLDGRVLAIGIEGGAAFSALLDPARGTWKRTHGTMTRPYVDGALVVLADGRVLAAGGTVAEPDATEIFEPAGETWRPGPPRSQPRRNSAYVRAGERVLAIGGVDREYSRSTAVEAWIPGETEWTSLPPLPAAFVRPRACVLADGSVFASDFGNAAHWDPTTEAWTPIPKSPSSEDAALVAFGDGVALLGGVYGAGYSSESVSVWSGEKGWRAAKSLPGERANATAIVLADGRIALVGGETIDSSSDGGESDIEYRSASWSHSALASAVFGTPDGGWKSERSPVLARVDAVRARETIVAVGAESTHLWSP